MVPIDWFFFTQTDAKMQKKTWYQKQDEEETVRLEKAPQSSDPDGKPDELHKPYQPQPNTPPREGNSEQLLLDLFQGQ